jgi:ferredoxin
MKRKGHHKMDRKSFFQQLYLEVKKSCYNLIENHQLLNVFIGSDKKLEVNKVSKQRPPGAAKDDKEFIKRCIGCDACMVACPINIIMIEDLNLRYPLIYPELNPCTHCEDYPCIRSCPTDALNLNNGTQLNLLPYP